MSGMMFALTQTKQQIQAILSDLQLRPLKQYGQHFLIDHNLMSKLVESAEVGSTDVILEVGPGTGSLTELLLERAAHVIAVEIDRGLFESLTDRLPSEHM